MKSVLVQPPGNSLLRVPPLGLGYVAAVLKQRGFDVEVLDLNVDSSALDAFLSVERPSVVGVSCGIGNVRQAFEAIWKVKACFPGCFVVLGGPYPSLMGEEMLTRHSDVDAAVMGEGESTIVEFFERFQNGQGLCYVDGLVFRDEKKVKHNSPRKPIEPLDGLPFPARENLPMELYGENAGVMFTSRGCPFQCVFCSRSVFGRKWRGHSPEYVLAEIEHLIRRYGVSCVSFLDDNFAFGLERAEKILEKIKNFVERTKVDGVHVSMATPIPDTELWSWVEKNGHWLSYDRDELLDWPIDDVADAYPVFETSDFTA